MKKLIQIFILLGAVISIQQAHAAPVAPPGWMVKVVATGGLLAGESLDGVIVDPVTANVYVTSTSNKLFKITPAGVVTLSGVHTLGHFEVFQMAWGPDGKIYSVGIDGFVYSIDPATAVATYYGDAPCGGCRYGLNFDQFGKLIYSYESLYDFYRINPGGAPTFLGTTDPFPPNFNHGDAFGILPNGDYAVYTDCGGENNYAISTAGHVDGTPYSLAWTGTTNIFSLMAGCGYSIGTVDPLTGNIFTTISNFGSGNDKILLTPGSGGASSVFISGGTGITNLYSGKASNGNPNNSLYFVDLVTNTVYEVVAPPPCADLTFSYTGAPQFWTVPSGVSSITVDVIGAEGGQADAVGMSVYNPRGKGGRVQAEIPVTAGDVLNIYVGQKGGDASPGIGGSGGYNGGGKGGFESSYYNSASGGGGGASDIRLNGSSLGDRIVVAGGAGGNGTNCLIAVSGGAGGDLTGGTGQVDCTGGITPGKGGTQVSGGAPGVYSCCGAIGLPGSFGLGANSNTITFSPFGGPGGGGYWGGGSGAQGGGGGGSSFTIPSASSVVHTPGYNTGNGVVKIFYVGNDTEKPMITCPGNITYITAPGNCGPVPSSSIALGTPITSDNCKVKTVSNNAPSSYALGVTNVKWTVTDSKGNTNTCIQKVTIIAGTCGQPIKIYHRDTTVNSALIKWTSGNPCVTSYQLRIRQEITPGIWSSWSSWVNYNGAPINEHLFTDLDSDTYFNYQIRSKCGSATNSITVNGWFHTLGGALKKQNVGIVEKQNKQVLLDQKTIGNAKTDLGVLAIPNPANEYVSLQIAGFENATKELMMFDLSGKLIFRVNLDASENAPELDLKRLNVKSGLHMIRVSDGVNLKTIELMIAQ